MAFTQLDPPIPLHVAERGTGVAVAVIDYGQDYDLLWVVGMVRPQPASAAAGQLVDGPAQESAAAKREDRGGGGVIRTGATC